MLFVFPPLLLLVVVALTEIFKLFFQSHAVVRETLLADQSVSGGGKEGRKEGGRYFYNVQCLQHLVKALEASQRMFITVGTVTRPQS